MPQDMTHLRPRPHVSHIFESATFSFRIQKFPRPHVAYSNRTRPSCARKIQSSDASVVVIILSGQNMVVFLSLLKFFFPRSKDIIVY